MKASFTAIVLAGMFLAAGISYGEPLTRGNQTIRWSGVVWGTSSPDAPTTQTGCPSLPTSYANADGSTLIGRLCDGYHLEIDLPSDLWSAREGGVQIAIRWEDPTHETVKDIDLFVYDGAGTLLGKSEGMVSEAEALMLPALPNGDYLVLAARALGDTALGNGEDLHYQGMAQVEFAPRSTGPARDLLPDLYPIPIYNIEFRSQAYYTLTPTSVSSCYPEERLEQGAAKCMRFNQGVGNRGEGRFEIRYEMPPESASLPLGSTEVELRPSFQRIYRSDGTKRDIDAGAFEYHPTHAHFHYMEFAQSRLYFANEDGTKGALARTGRKNGFCMADVEYPNFGLKGDYSGRTYQFPVECHRPNEIDPTTGKAYLVTGISTGWADNYVWFLADQFIEVSGLGDGYYIIETSVGGHEGEGGQITEARTDNNCNATLILLTNMDVEMSTGDIVRDLGAC